MQQKTSDRPRILDTMYALMVMAGALCAIILIGTLLGRLTGIKPSNQTEIYGTKTAARSAISAALNSTRPAKLLGSAGLIAVPYSETEASIRSLKRDNSPIGFFCGNLQESFEQPWLYDGYVYNNYIYSVYDTEYEGYDGTVREAIIADIENGTIERALSVEFVPPFISDLGYLERYDAKKVPEGVTPTTREWYDSLDSKEIRVVSSNECMGVVLGSFGAFILFSFLFLISLFVYRVTRKIKA